MCSVWNWLLLCSLISQFSWLRFLSLYMISQLWCPRGLFGSRVWWGARQSGLVWWARQGASGRGTGARRPQCATWALWYDIAIFVAAMSFPVYDIAAAMSTRPVWYHAKCDIMLISTTSYTPPIWDAWFIHIG